MSSIEMDKGLNVNFKMVGKEVRTNNMLSLKPECE